MTSTNSVNNVGHSDFNSEYLKAINKGDSALASLFDNTAVINDSKKDTDKVNSIKDSVNNAKAGSKTIAKAKKLLEKFGVGKKIADHTIYETKPASTDKLESNSFKVKIKTGGKEQWMKITCDEDGNYKMTGKINGKDVNYLYDKNDTLRRKKVVDGNKTTISDYDANGKINRKYVKEGDTEKSYRYDDSGKLTKKTINDGTTTKTTNYEYDKKGNVVGTRTVKTFNNDTSTPKKKIIASTIYSSDGKKVGQRVRNQFDGTTIDKTFDASGKVKEAEKIDSEGKSIEKRTYLSTTKNSDGTSTRIAKVDKGDGEIYYHRQILDKDGKVKTTLRYNSKKDAEAGKNNYSKKYEYGYDSKGNLKKQKISYKTGKNAGKTRTNTWKNGTKIVGKLK